MQRRQVLSAAVMVVIGACAIMAVVDDARAEKPGVFTGLVNGVGAGGYDPVAYFAAGKAVKGDPSITATHAGATWRFSSDKNRQAFVADPSRFAPQFGGYCAYAVARNYTAKGDPNAWSIVDGKLYLNYSKSVRATWSKNVSGEIADGDRNWPTVLK